MDRSGFTDRPSSSHLTRGADSGSGGSGGKPVLLDLDGVELAELGDSNTYFDVAGDGSQHRTAWAGAGDGILVRDADNDGVINRAHEIDFTQWDASAASDMEALRNVFDTHRDDKLNAADTDFALFPLLLLLANYGAQTVRNALAQPVNAGLSAHCWVPQFFSMNRSEPNSAGGRLWKMVRGTAP